MSTTLIISVLSLYFGALIFISWLTSRKSNTDSFFTGNRQSPWYLVAFGMIGASLSGVTFISVPGNVGKTGFAYYQVVLGYLLGYAVIAYVLMPLYYRLHLISIYTYLNQRLGKFSYKTGVIFFMLSRTLGSAMRLFLATSVLQIFVFDSFGIPFEISVLVTVLLIWVYTFKGGIKTIVWTDTFQTFFLVSSVIICVVIIMQDLGISIKDLPGTIASSGYAEMFHFEDYKSKLFFPKMFFGGMFLAITMTGLDQDLMQKNLTCRNIGDAQKNMISFTFVLMFINLLFLTLGALLYMYLNANQMEMPSASDELFPRLALNNFGLIAGVFFLLGITASSYASADSALAALTTSFCIDFLNFESKPENQKKREKFIVHLGFSVLFIIIIIITKYLADRALIDLILTLASYTYGPLLGLFAFGIFTKRNVIDKFTPFICLLSPMICYLLDKNSMEWLNGYKFGFELLILNGLLTLCGLIMISKKQNKI
jgi:SSS family transporter